MNAVPALAVASATFTTNPLTVRAALAAAAGAASTDLGRLILTNVQVSLAENTITLRSTDSYRASKIEITTVDNLPSMHFLVNAKKLLAGLPKVTQARSGMTLCFGQSLDIETEDTTATMPIEFDSPTYPNVEQFFETFDSEHHTYEPTGFNPAYIAAIGKEVAAIRNADEKERSISYGDNRPLVVQFGSTELKPSVFRFSCLSISYRCLLMPVRQQ